MVPPMGNRSGASGAAVPRAVEDVPAEQLPGLPWRVPLDRAPWWAWGLFLVPFVAVPLLNTWLWMGGRDLLAVALFTIIGASVVRVAGGVVLYRVEVTATALKARTSLLVRSLAWQDVDRVEAGEGFVVLTTGQDENEINGITKDRSPYVAGVIEAARRAAADQPVRRARPRPGLGVLLVLLYLVLSVGAFAWKWHLV
ncbi:hypothetical protein FB561_0856 [Kribbella amoyensis]|uniref:Uncharacterized protein n=1 Tax=Kribbella amoyensis TaxID=996641 RepID=A0A561BLL5_9ACTN|nr:hypothetical protein FB561_0856 [Kribbella amoyensis]